MMEKKKLIVPPDVRYLKEWKEFKLPFERCIIDKKITGCGFTEFVLCNPVPSILCSPRIKLLENKYKQHPEAFYYKDISEETFRGFTKETKFDLGELGKRLMTYINSSPCPKILTTYDSFKWIKQILDNNSIFDKFQVVVDEFQAILSDSLYRGKVSYEFLELTTQCPRLCYVSATPTLDEYLYRIPGLNLINYYEFDWGNRLKKAKIHIRFMDSIESKVKEIIDFYRDNKYFAEKYNPSDPFGGTIKSEEAVFFINSVEKVRDIIKKLNLTPEECNILMADTESNRRKIRDGFGYKKTSTVYDSKIFGESNKIPLRGEKHKPFTFCTKTVYWGADFYSTNASTYIFSDGNIGSLANDPIEDIEQIIGRQRLEENPWKGEALVYIIRTRESNVEEEFKKEIEKKELMTIEAISTWNNSNFLRNEYIKLCENGTGYIMYSNGKFVRNPLAALQDERVLKLQNVDYADRFCILDMGTRYDVVNSHIQDFYNNFATLTTIPEKLKYLCEFDFKTPEEYADAFNFMYGLDYKNKFLIRVLSVFGKENIQRAGYNHNFKPDLERYDKDHNVKSELSEVIKIGETYTKKDLKDILQKVFNEVQEFPEKATSKKIERYYKVERRQIKKQEALLILDVKD